VRVLFCYAEDMDASARAALAIHAPSAELAYTGTSETAYWQAVNSRWNDEQDLMLIEQDIVIRADVVQSFLSCPKSWCVFPYAMPGYGLAESLGCTRFRKEAMAAVPVADIPGALMYPVRWTIPSATGQTLWAGVNESVTTRITTGCDTCSPTEICWRHLDWRVSGALREKGYKPHLHAPDVEHQHRRKQ